MKFDIFCINATIPENKLDKIENFLMNANYDYSIELPDDGSNLVHISIFSTNEQTPIDSKFIAELEKICEE